MTLKSKQDTCIWYLPLLISRLPLFCFITQAVIDANLIQPLIMVLETGEYKAQKEAVWAVSNITVGGTSEQVGFLVRSGVISPLCRLLAVKDSQIVQVILDALSSTLRVS